jgi:hypothetical protein
MPDFAPIVEAKVICRASNIRNQTLVIGQGFVAVKRGFPVG